MPSDPHVTTFTHGATIVGATGAVGREVLRVLHERGVKASKVRALASDQSTGTLVPFGDDDVVVEPTTPERIRSAPVSIFAATADIARRFAPEAVAGGTVVIDNSSAFRMDPGVPLIVPGVNGGTLHAGSRLIANPNCSTIMLVVALEPLRRAFGIARVVVSTYQAVSGAGLGAIAELRSQLQTVLDGGEPRPRFFKEPCAFNLFSHDSEVDVEDGVNGEERKIMLEAARIWEDRTIQVTPTCVRVPVIRAHSQSVMVDLRTAVSLADVRSEFRDGKSISIVDDRVNNAFPTPLKATDQDNVLIGRIRPDPAQQPDENDRYTRFCFFACADQLRRGAATNALDIAARLGLLPG